ncbi:MAG: CoA transferase [Ilumatobacteraceae bacterium]
MNDDRHAPGGPTEGRHLPLEGIRVIEFGYGIAAPVAARNLGQFGADSIRVESRRKPDSLRVGGAGWIPKGYDPGVRWDTMPSLNFSSAGKRSIGLEIDSDDGYAVLQQLVARSDVFITNMSADVLPRLRLTYADLQAVRPDLVYMSMPPFGDARSPYRSFRTWGQNLSAISGVDRMIGWPDRDPVQLGFAYPDYVSAQAGTMAVVAALDRRDRTGQGCEIELSQYEMALAAIGPAVLELGLRGTVRSTNGNRVEGVAPQGIYPCRGPERWVAVSVRDDDMWAALGTVRGLTHLAGDRYATVALREAAADALDEQLTAWTSVRTDWEAATELQLAGVAASPVEDPWDLLTDPHLAAREAFRVLPHPRFGGDLVFGQAVTMSDTEPRFARAAPGLGQDSRDILTAVVGMEDEEVDRLVAAGVVHEMNRPDTTLERPFLHWIHTVSHLPWPASTFEPAELFMKRLEAEMARDADEVGP